jgi:hypothetical protein
MTGNIATLELSHRSYIDTHSSLWYHGDSHLLRVSIIIYIRWSTLASVPQTISANMRVPLLRSLLAGGTYTIGSRRVGLRTEASLPFSTENHVVLTARCYPPTMKYLR